MSNSRTRRFKEQVPDEDELQGFVKSTRSKNTTKSTTQRIKGEDQVMRLIQCFLQTVRKKDKEQYEPGRLNTIYYEI